MFKDRRAFLVCKNTTTNVNYSFLIDSNIKNCSTTSYNIVTNLKTLNLPVGSYKLYLNLPDPLNSNKLYSIQTSNLNLWTTEGFNDLQQTYLVSSIVVTRNKQIEMGDDKIVKVKIYNLYGQLISEDLDLSVINEGPYIMVGQTMTNRTITKKFYNNK